MEVIYTKPGTCLCCHGKLMQRYSELMPEWCCCCNDVYVNYRDLMKSSAAVDLDEIHRIVAQNVKSDLVNQVSRKPQRVVDDATLDAERRRINEVLKLR